MSVSAAAFQQGKIPPSPFPGAPPPGGSLLPHPNIGTFHSSEMFTFFHGSYKAYKRVLNELYAYLWRDYRQTHCFFVHWSEIELFCFPNMSSLRLVERKLPKYTFNCLLIYNSSHTFCICVCRFQLRCTSLNAVFSKCIYISTLAALTDLFISILSFLTEGFVHITFTWFIYLFLKTCRFFCPLTVFLW